MIEPTSAPGGAPLAVMVSDAARDAARLAAELARVGDALRAALDGLDGDARVVVTVAVAVLPPGGAVAVKADAPRPLDPLDAAILRAVRDIVRRTSRPARTDAVAVQVSCETQLELTIGTVRRRLADLEAQGRLYRLSPRTGWLVEL